MQFDEYFLITQYHVLWKDEYFESQYSVPKISIRCSWEVRKVSHLKKRIHKTTDYG